MRLTDSVHLVGSGSTSTPGPLRRSRPAALAGGGLAGGCGTERRRLVAAADAEAMSVEVGKRAEFYPEDFQPEPCPVRVRPEDGATAEVGLLQVKAIATPGHAVGHTSYLVEDGSTRILQGGDLVFAGGGISLLNSWDCELAAYQRSVLRFHDAGLPGHHSISLGSGQRHLDSAIRRLDAGFFRPSVV